MLDDLRRCRCACRWRLFELSRVSGSEATGVVTLRESCIFLFFLKAREAAKTRRTAEQAPPCARSWA